MTRLIRVWGTLEPEQRLAAVAALALLVTMFLPWYELQSLNRKTGVINSHSISAFGDVSFVEAAVFLVAAGVIVLLFARAESRDFHMPGSDGAVVMVAGCWAALLIFYRVFSRPSGHGYPVGIQWGFFLAFVAAGALGYAGWRMRNRERPEPPMSRSRRPRARPPRTDREEILEEPTVRISSSPVPAAHERDPQPPPRYPPAPQTPTAPRPRQSPPPPSSQQLSLEDEQSSNPPEES